VVHIILLRVKCYNRCDSKYFSPIRLNFSAKSSDIISVNSPTKFFGECYGKIEATKVPLMNLLRYCSELAEFQRKCKTYLQHTAQQHLSGVIELLEKIQISWLVIFLDINKKLVESIPERIDAATRAKSKYKDFQKVCGKIVPL